MPSKTWSVLELLRWSTEYFTDKSVGEPRLSGELLLADTLGLKRLDLYLQFDRPLEAEELAAYKQKLLRRARHEPLQYIVGHTDFREIRLRVDGRALIPRPETEVLVGEVLAWAADRDQPPRALDLGTGSGAIALSLAAEGEFSEVVATDASADALALARENLELLAPSTPVDLRLGDLFEPVSGEIFDVIVSNPPYVGDEERDALDAEVREWEPAAALFAGAGGLEVIERLIRAAPAHLAFGGLLALEIGAAQADAVADLVRAAGAFAEPSVRADLAGRPRVLMVTLNGTRGQAPLRDADTIER